jgi:cupin superfamily acireductone dioxygenase involved in methionine salvage
MIDLKDKNTEELIQKHQSILGLIKNPNEWPQYAGVIDVGINHIKSKYNNVDLNWKTWASAILIKNASYLKSEKEVIDLIDNFLDYVKTNYQFYVDDLGMSVNDYEKDRGFVYRFLDANKQG